MKKSTSKIANVAVIITFIITTSLLASAALHKNQKGLLIPVFITTPIFLAGILMRRSSWSKPYFTSKYNIFTAKTRHRQELDFPKHLLFEKLIEIMPETGFKIRNINEDTGDIFATTPISWVSWGENIYIHLKETNGKTMVDFCSTCLFQLSSWGKNERNYDKLIEEFEKSLTI
jgi:hypothetical protein